MEAIKDKKIENDANPLVIDVDQNDPVTEIESLCMNCHDKGTTRLLTTKIPFFKDIIVMSFSCPHCGFRNSDIEDAKELSPHGIHFVLTVKTSKDMDRRIIKSNYASLNIPCCGLEIPSMTQKGKLSTIEGFISKAKENFSASLKDGYYAEMGDDYINKIKEIIQKLSDTLNGDKFPFELILDDPSGNSFIENPYAPQTDPNIKVSYFDRTKEMIEQMGFSVENQKQELQSEKNKDSKEKKENAENKDTGKEDHVKISYYNKKKDFTVYKPRVKYSQMIVDFTEGIDDQNSDIDNKIIQFPANCYCCNAPGFLRDCVCSIPYFKEIIISCFKCDQCGYKTTNVRGGGGISEKGEKMTLSVETPEDLNRDVFKSETSKICIPEVGFETSEGSMGSMFTTVEGIIDKICTQLLDTPFSSGDSSDNSINNFVMKLRDLKQLNKKFTFILDDPLSNSFIFPIGEGKNDERLKKEEYERTFEQNEDLGINDMKVENYEEDSNDDEKNN
jgi:zinc finger protein